MKRYMLFSCLFFAASSAFAADRLDNLSLDQAIQTALHNHRSLQVSQASLEMAEAQYQQAMNAFGPRVNLEAGFQRADQARTFTFNGTVQTPAMTSTTVTPFGPLVTVTPSQALTLNMDVKMFDRDVSKAALNFSYPLYTGGKQQALEGMAGKGVAIAKQEQHKTELEVVRDVSKYYSGAQFTQQMEQLVSDTLERFQALEDLTDRLYQNASLKVKKTDYLRSKTTTAMTRSMLHEARYASALSKEALINAMGLPLGTSVSLAQESDQSSSDGNLDALITDAMQFNPDKQRLELAVQAAEYQIDDARSGYLPVVGLEASTYQVWNAYNGGLFNDANRKGWTIGVGLKWDLFDSGLTRAKVSGARSGKMKLEAQKVLLDNGLALQVKDSFLRIKRSRAQVDDSAQAQDYAEQNRKLNVRAYQEEMVETKDVIEAQLIESFASIALYRARQELQTARADLDYLVGRALQETQP